MLSEDLSNARAPYTLKLHPMTLKDEGNDMLSTVVAESDAQTISLGEDLAILDGTDPVFYAIAFDKKDG